MRPALSLAFIATFGAAALTAQQPQQPQPPQQPQQPQQPAQPAAASAPTAPTAPATPALPVPAVGSMAPDFTLPGATREGLMSMPLSLSELRGRTVVLAFFPAARTRGCTVQLETYRDRFGELFAGGERVVIVAVSTDADTTLASWAKDAQFPMLFGSDTARAVSRAYGSLRGNVSSRNLFVIAPDGRIAHRMTPFNVLSQGAYTELAEAVKATLATGATGAGSGATRER